MAKNNEIAKAESASLQPLENIENLIHVIRGKQVMLDRDLARLYGVETRVLNQAVQRNNERFPGDFMFQLNKEEAESSRSQFVMLNADAGDLKSQVSSYSPDWQSGHIVHCPGCHSGVLRPLARHWMPVSSVDSGSYPDYFASKRLFHPPSPCNLHFLLAYLKKKLYLCSVK